MDIVLYVVQDLNYEQDQIEERGIACFLHLFESTFLKKSWIALKATRLAFAQNEHLNRK